MAGDYVNVLAGTHPRFQVTLAKRTLYFNTLVELRECVRRHVNHSAKISYYNRITQKYERKPA